MGFDFCWFLPFLGKVSFNISRPYETERFTVQYKQVIFLKHQCLSSASSVHRRERRHHRHHQHQQHHHEDHHDHQGASGQVIFSKHQCLSSASFLHSKHWQLQKFPILNTAAWVDFSNKLCSRNAAKCSHRNSDSKCRKLARD